MGEYFRLGGYRIFYNGKWHISEEDIFTRVKPNFNFTVEESIQPVPAAPTADESLRTKPRCQRSCRRVYPKAIQPLRDIEFYRRLYYQLQKNMDRDLLRVFETLRHSVFYRNTIVIFSSDHGELMGAHGGLFQSRNRVEMLTSHVDLLPTMLGLAGINLCTMSRGNCAGTTQRSTVW